MKQSVDKCRQINFCNLCAFQIYVGTKVFKLGSFVCKVYKFFNSIPRLFTIRRKHQCRSTCDIVVVHMLEDWSKLYKLCR